MLENSKKGN